MVIQHYGVLKGIAWASGAAAAAILVMDTNIKVALIAVIPLTISSLGTLWLALLARKDKQTSDRILITNQDSMKTSQGELDKKLDGHFTRATEQIATLIDEKAAQGKELVSKTDKLAHAEGRQEERDTQHKSNKVKETHGRQRNQ